MNYLVLMMGVCSVMPANKVAYAAADESRHSDWAKPVKPELNLYQVTPTLYRSEQIEKKDVQLIKKLGIKTVVSLRAFHKDNKLLDHEAITTKRIKMYTWRIRDKEVVAALREIKAAEKLGPVLLHCQHGADRTGLIAAMYRMVFQDWVKDKAVRELKQGGYGYHSMWRNILKYLHHVNVEKIRQQVNDVKPLPVKR